MIIFILIGVKYVGVIISSLLTRVICGGAAARRPGAMSRGQGRVRNGRGTSGASAGAARRALWSMAEIAMDRGAAPGAGGAIQRSQCHTIGG